MAAEKPTPPFDTFVFDVDGTLLDTLDDLVVLTNDALAEFNLLSAHPRGDQLLCGQRREGAHVPGGARRARPRTWPTPASPAGRRTTAPIPTT